MYLSGTIQSSAQISPKDSLLVKSFYQGANAGNCASISVIKLAIAKYGADHVLKSIQYLPTGYSVQLQNDVVIMLSKMEEGTISHLDKFQLGTSCDILQKAKFMYAIMAKNKMLIDKLSVKTF